MASRHVIRQNKTAMGALGALGNGLLIFHLPYEVQNPTFSCLVEVLLILIFVCVTRAKISFSRYSLFVFQVL